MSQSFHNMLVETLPRLRAYAIMMTRDSSAADDLLQEAVVRALAAETQFTMGTNFKAWMYRIIRNQYISNLRRNRRTSTNIDDLPEGMLGRPANQENQVLVTEISGALNKLERGQREALILVCGSGMSYEEAAEVLECSIGTVKSRVWRARNRMHDFIVGDDEKSSAEPIADDKGEREAKPSRRTSGPIPVHAIMV